MKYRYTIADAANREAFEEAVPFIIKKLHFKPDGEALTDVDGSLRQKFTGENGYLILESDVQVDYVGIVSDSKLPINCLHKWTLR